MAYDQRGGRRDRGPEWRGDDGFGGGWGNQVPRPQRLGDRNWRGQPDDDGPERGEPYVGGYRGTDYDDRSPGGWQSGGIGADAEFSGPRFDRADVGSVGSHGVHPVASASAPCYGGAGFGSSAREAAIMRQARQRHHDPHYHDWRERQIAEFDRDYEEYRRENQSRFDSEFSAWRSRRSEQRAAVGRVREHMEVTGADGGHVGTVDCIRDERVILTGGDADAGGLHHAIPCSWIDRVEDKIVLNIDAEEAKRRWQGEARSRALFEREDLGQRGPHVLNRSFAGIDSDED